MTMDVVWLNEYRRFAFLLSRNAYVSIVSMQVSDTEWHQVQVENDDYELWEERAIDYDTE